MKKITLDKLINVDDTGMPKAPDIYQLQDKDIRELYTRDQFPDKRMYIAECGFIYYMGDPKSPARQQGLSDNEILKLAIENYNLPQDYVPDELVLRIVKRYYKQNITEAGVAIEALHKSIHLVSIAANKINDLLNEKLSSTINQDEIGSILTLMDGVSKRISEIPNLVKSLGTAYENLRNEEETQMARGGKQILSSMSADDDE